MTAASGWTVQRLINAASLGGVAVLVGGLIFQRNFRVLGGDHRALLAMGFGLFAIGMVVLTLGLIGLAAAGVSALIAGQGMAAAVLLAFAPLIPLILLNALGVLSFAFPAFFVIVVAGGFALALRRR